MTCRVQHFGRYLEGQEMITILSRSMTLQQKGVQPITLLFQVGFYNFLTKNYKWRKTGAYGL